MLLACISAASGTSLKNRSCSRVAGFGWMLLALPFMPLQSRDGYRPGTCGWRIVTLVPIAEAWVTAGTCPRPESRTSSPSRRSQEPVHPLVVKLVSLCRQQQAEARQQEREAHRLKPEFFASKSFAQSGANEETVAALAGLGFTRPSHVQARIHDLGSGPVGPAHANRVLQRLELFSSPALPRMSPFRGAECVGQST